MRQDRPGQKKNSLVHIYSREIFRRPNTKWRKKGGKNVTASRKVREHARSSAKILSERIFNHPRQCFFIAGLLYARERRILYHQGACTNFCFRARTETPVSSNFNKKYKTSLQNVIQFRTRSQKRKEREIAYTKKNQHRFPTDLSHSFHQIIILH